MCDRGTSFGLGDIAGPAGCWLWFNVTGGLVHLVVRARLEGLGFSNDRGT